MKRVITRSVCWLVVFGSMVGTGLRAESPPPLRPGVWHGVCPADAHRDTFWRLSVTQEGRVEFSWWWLPHNLPGYGTGMSIGEYKSEVRLVPTKKGYRLITPRKIRFDLIREEGSYRLARRSAPLREGMLLAGNG